MALAGHEEVGEEAPLCTGIGGLRHPSETPEGSPGEQQEQDAARRHRQRIEQQLGELPAAGPHPDEASTRLPLRPGGRGGAPSG